MCQGMKKVCGRCVECVWKVCQGMKKVCGRCEEGVRKVCGRCEEGVWKVCGRCVEATGTGVYTKGHYREKYDTRASRIIRYALITHVVKLLVIIEY